MAKKTFNDVRIQIKRDSASNWETNNPVLLYGEEIIVDTNAGEVRKKVGDGVKTYTQLPFTDESIRTSLSEKTAAINKLNDLVGVIPVETQINDAIGAIDIPKHTWETLPDKPFGLDRIYGTDTITWDGTRTGLVSIYSNNGRYLCKVSDVVPTVEDLQNGYGISLVQRNSEGPDVPETSTVYSGQPHESGAIVLSNIVIVPESAVGVQITLNPNTYSGWYWAAAAVFPEPGIYFQYDQSQSLWVKAFRIKDYTFYTDTIVKIDPMYMPDSMGTVKTIDNIKPDENGNINITHPDQINSNWNQNDESSKEYIKNRTHYRTIERDIIIVPEVVVTASGQTISTKIMPGFDYSPYGFYIMINNEIYFNGPESKFPIMEEGSAKTAVFIYGNPSLYSSSYEDNGYPFCIYRPTLENKSTILLKNTEDAPMTIEIFRGIVNYKTLDETYIPNTIARKSDLGEVDHAKSSDAATKDGDGNVITSTYETKANAIDKLEEAKGYTDSKIADLVGSESVKDQINDAISSKADDVDLTTHTENTTVHITAQERAIWNAKASTAVATSSTDGLMAAEDKAKLDDIEEGANKYTHPTSHAATMITEDTSHRFVTDAEKSSWNAKASTALASTSSNGLMSSTDKAKLDAIDANANKYTHPSYTAKSAGLYKVTVDATGHVSDTTAVTAADITGLGIVGTDTKYTAGTGLELSGNIFNHSNRITAGTVKGDNTKTLTYAGTFTVPSITYDSEGHITEVGTTTMTMPAKPADYSHPSTHPATMITEDTTHRFVTDDQIAVWDNKVNDSELSSHTENKNNPHSVTKVQVGLSNVTNDAQVKRSEMGAANGVATLDSNGTIPASQLPSYVDDVIEGYFYNSKFHKDSAHTQVITGETGKIYVDLTNGINKTYRWSGTAYVVISETLALGETSSTAYPGNKGKDNAAAIVTINEKLSTIEDGANKYTHPSTHPASIIVQDTSNRFVTDAQIAAWNGKASTAVATSSANGLMSSGDKAKLDGIAANANNYSHPTYTAKASGLYKVTVDATGHVSATTAVAKADITALGIPAQDTTYSKATSTADGLMSKEDKGKLDGIATNANNYTHPSYTAKSAGLYKVTVDATGHVSATSAVAKADITGLGIPGSDTNTTYDLSAPASAANGNVKLNLTAGGSGSGTDTVAIKGSGATTVTTNTSGEIIISSTDNNTTYSNATTSTAGLMSAADKQQVDKIATLESKIAAIETKLLNAVFYG